jgi:hypothetical protein
LVRPFDWFWFYVFWSTLLFEATLYTHHLFGPLKDSYLPLLDPYDLPLNDLTLDILEAFMVEVRPTIPATPPTAIVIEKTSVLGA